MPENIKSIIASDSYQMAEKGAEIFFNTAQNAVSRQGFFRVAVSGGSTPRSMHRLFSQEPYLSKTPWHKTHIFWVDERMVSYDHPESNFGTARKDFLDKISIPPDQVHPMPVMKRSEEGALIYREIIKSEFQITDHNDPIFDLIVLGVGGDGHVASLFPGQPIIDDANCWVLSVKGGQPDVLRLTLNYHVLNSAKLVLFLVSGSGKTAIVKTLFKDRQAGLPASKIRPLNGKVIWVLDRAAASLL